MIIIRKIKELKEYLSGDENRYKSVGFVPTMGFLHEGHIELIKKCRSENDISIVSIFVNPTQFGEGEDYQKYPRDLERDIEILKKYDTDILFAPDNKEIYPNEQFSFVNVLKFSDVLCGKSRPGHFTGVATVVLKLFNIVKPNRAYFGKKDAQQLIIIKQMVKDLNLDILIKSIPIVREESGLALSSRNNYLSGEEKEIASSLSKTLNRAKQMVLSEEMLDPEFLKKFIIKELKKQEKITIDYIEIRSLKTLEETLLIDKKNTLVAAAIFINGIRLIDNFILGEI